MLYSHLFRCELKVGGDVRVRISLGSAFQERGPIVDIRAGGVTRSEAEHHLCV